MQKELANELLEIVRGTKEGILNGVEVAKEQIPDILQEILLFSHIEHSIWLGIFMILFLLCVGVFVYVLWYEKKSHRPWSDNFSFAFLVSVFGIIITLPGIGYFGIVLLKVIYAPKLYLIQFISAALN